MGDSAQGGDGLFVQLNARLFEEEDKWQEKSRWVKFQEDVDSSGRWSKPYVPSYPLSHFSLLQEQLEQGVILLDASGKTIDEILDEVLATKAGEHLDLKQREGIHHLFSQGVKHKMRMNILRQVSKTSELQVGRLSSREGEDLLEEDEKEDNTPTRKISTASLFNMSRKRSTLAVEGETPGRKISQKETSLKWREHNLFTKKVPRDAEAANIQVATTALLSAPMVAFIRLSSPVLLEDFCEIMKPTRFLVLLLGPPGTGASLLSLGRALGALMTDPYFCRNSAYTAATPDNIFSGLSTYMEELTVLPPNTWDPAIRLDPPKATQTLQDRVINRAAVKEDSKRLAIQQDGDDEDGDDPSYDPDHKQNFQEDDESLQFTGRFCGGLMADLRRKIPWFLSDFTDGLHPQTLSSIMYIYLATVTKAITFGGFLGEITDGLQGVMESFLGHMIAGGVFCLFGGQPLTVLGCTGPVLIFEKILVEFCHSYGIYYLTMRLWIGLWASFFCMIIVAVDGSAIVRYFTRFTEEAFAALVGIIFIKESLSKLFKMGKTFKVHMDFDLDEITTEEHCGCSAPNDTVLNQLNQMFEAKNTSLETIESWANYKNHSEEWSGELWTGRAEDIHYDRLGLKHCKLFMGVLSHSCEYVPDIFFLSVILFFGTFFTCTFIKNFKYTPFFPTKIRSIIADYAVVLTLILFVTFDHAFNLATPKLTVPTELKPTRSDLRDWWIPMTDPSSPWYIYLLASIPALLLTVLLFMDQQITSVIVNRKEHKLKKGAGYHLDMLVVGLMMGVCSLFGLPWCVAATVLCLGHVDSLKKDSESNAPGELPQFLGVREQRITGICVFLLVGLSTQLAPILKLIPMPVLYGVLMYMGVNTLRGMQFIDRLALMLMPTRHQPDHAYLRHVPLYKVHLFTGIQAATLVALWIIKSTAASLIFPLMVLAMVGFRKAMDYCPSLFSQRDLFYLDSLMPEKKKKNKSRRVGVGSDEEKETLQNGNGRINKGRPQV